MRLANANRTPSDWRKHDPAREVSTRPQWLCAGLKGQRPGPRSLKSCTLYIASHQLVVAASRCQLHSHGLDSTLQWRGVVGIRNPTIPQLACVCWGYHWRALAWTMGLHGRTIATLFWSEVSTSAIHPASILSRSFSTGKQFHDGSVGNNWSLKKNLYPWTWRVDRMISTARRPASAFAAPRDVLTFQLHPPPCLDGLLTRSESHCGEVIGCSTLH
ncbi:hypothetical protein B0J13DRAFT_261352 [Dactylonectria estremocensis]|uniref:Uncharacterized protein n=1 Tax=Dactylonectria estremocensis TaxID=1079267 RepID=A0A9P9F3P6_9HYPO|nr:hypothetical protein B0J13DRAFT_261352 [Dactylonectria estremocensis]